MRIIKLLIWSLSMILLSYILISVVGHLVFPQEEISDPRLFEPSYLRVIVGFIILLGFTGWLTLKDKNTHKKALDEVIIAFLTSIGFASLYNALIQIDVVRYFTFIILTGLFYILVNLITDFYTSVSLTDVKTIYLNLKSSRLKVSTFNPLFFLGKITPKNYIFIMIVTSVGLLLLFILNAFRTGQIAMENKIRKSFYITSIDPAKAVATQSITIRGYNFGDVPSSDTRYRVIIDGALINGFIEKWEENKVTFEVPLSLNPGKHKIRLQKAEDYFSKKSTILYSNSQHIEIYSRFIINPAVNDSRLDRAIKKLKKILFINMHVYPPYMFNSYE